MIDINKLFNNNPTKDGLVIGCNNFIDFTNLLDLLHSINILEKDLSGSKDAFVVLINNKSDLYYVIASKNSPAEKYYKNEEPVYNREKYIIMDYMEVVGSKSIIDQIEDNLDKLYGKLL